MLRIAKQAGQLLQVLSPPTIMQIKNRELHRIVLTAIIYKSPGQNIKGGSEDIKYLIVKRNPTKKAFPGKWTVPGGGLEVDDYINVPKTTSDHWYFAVENALRREIKEESGLDVEKPKYLLDIVFIRSDGIPVVILSYFCKWKSNEVTPVRDSKDRDKLKKENISNGVKLNKENTDYKWVGFQEAKNYDLVPGLLGEIEMVDKILKGENPDRIHYNNRPNI